MEDAPKVVSIFGCQLFRWLLADQPQANIALSPFSLVSVVSLAMAGTQRSTEREMALALVAKVPQFHKSMRRILIFQGGTPGPDEVETFRMANRIYVDQRLPLLDGFRKIGERVYRITVSSANFAERPDTERLSIDAWVKAVTGIGNVVPPICVGPATRILLLSVAYVNCKWKQPFLRATLQRKPFGEEQTVEMMTNVGIYGYVCLNDVGLRAVDIPFSIESCSLTIIVPVRPFQEFYKILTPELLERVVEGVKAKRKLRLEIPKFAVSYDVELSRFLQEIGMREAFTAQANFRTVTTAADAYLSAIIHKVEFCASEGCGPTNLEATEAAALPELEFTVDRPFMFVFRRYDYIALMGCVQRIPEN
ncbi:leukocyte elastase inhibitor-like [Ornithodoros turicata]|uniref:leukocyte elastase inhibitor-like n=1 Tax=Ornithodoros turicata TaxID=34597 RepID=UPI00313A45B6